MSPRSFRLFACCIPVRGARRSTICDLQRESYRFIPNGLYEILTVHRGLTVEQIKEVYENNFDAEIEEYFAFLVGQEFGFFTSEPELFPDLDLSWDAPEAITNAIVDVGPDSCHDFDAILRQLDDLHCRALQLRFFRAAELDELDGLLGKASCGRLHSIDLLAPFCEGWTLDALEQVCRRHPRLTNFQVHSAPRQAFRRLGDSVLISVHTQVVDSAAHCGQVHPVYFATSLELFTEAQKHNTCLNRKISVDQHGDIRNCPALPKSFGNLRDTSLQSALLQQDFRELWLINKDQVEVCKDCEFRYICTDCRAFIRRPEDRYSKPSKCAYDPYSAEWA